MSLNLPLGTSDFREIIENKYYLIDKSLLIGSILSDPSKVILFPRPRRFGKTLNLSMLYYFLDGYLESEHQHLFDGLAITKNQAICEKYQNQYPVITLSLKEIKERNFEDALTLLKTLISRLYTRYYDFLFCTLKPHDQKTYQRLLDKTGDSGDLQFSLFYLSEWLFKKTGQKVIILIDEYDTPVTEAYQQGYYESMTNLMRGILGALKDNPYLEKAILTGITRITKESIFSDLNHFDIYSVLDPSFPQYFGFTEEEVQQLLIDDGHPEQLDKVREWYNGYQFGATVLYNPWSILKCVKRQYLFEPYWINTSSNHLIRDLIASAKSDVKASFVALLQGEAIARPVNKHIVFPHLKTSEEALWGLLVSAGYLTVIERPKEESMICKVRIPNREVALFYKRMFEEWFSDPLSKDNYDHFVRSLANGEVERFSQLLNEYLAQTGSYFDFNRHSSEKVFHTFVLGLVVGLSERYHIQSNRESGFGRFDVLLEPKGKEDAGIVLEFKVTSDREALEKTAELALTQIKEKEYLTTLKQRGVKRFELLGIGFCGQQALVKREAFSGEDK